MSPPHALPHSCCACARALKLCLPALVVALAVPGIVGADRIFLTNGRHLDGLIVTEGRDAITLRVEGGEMRVARRRIKEIRYSSPERSRAIEEAWKRKYFLHEDYIPPGMADLAGRVRALRDRRRSAVAAQRGLESSAAREKTLRDERARLHDDLARAGEALRSMAPDDDVHAYNRQVTRMNDLRIQVTARTDALGALPELKRGWRDLVSAYKQELEAVRSEVAGLYGDGGGGLTGEDSTFLNRLLIETGRMASEFRTNTAPLDFDRYGHTVLATINGRQPGRFVVDTGAAVMTLSESFARAIGLQWDSARDTVELVMANGARVDGVGVLLDRVEVGGVSSRDVRAVILAKPPGEDLDGLLGMSFLGRFQVKMEPGNRRLTFTEFAPGAE